MNRNGFRDFGRFRPMGAHEQERADLVSKYYDKRDELKHRKEETEQLDALLQNLMYIDRKILRCMDVLLSKQYDLNSRLEDEVDGLRDILYEEGAV